MMDAMQAWALCVAVALVAMSAAPAAAAGPYTIPDAELAANFAVEWGAGTLAKTDPAGPGVAFLMTLPDKTAAGDNYPVGDEAGLLWDPVLHHYTSLAANDSIAMVIRYVSGPAGSDVDVHLFMNTGLTGPSGNPSNQPANDTFWGGSWVTLAVGETKTVVLDFGAAEAYSAADNPEPHSGAGQAWADGQVHAINERDRNEVSHLGIEVADFDGDTGGQAVTLLLNAPDPARPSPQKVYEQAVRNAGPRDGGYGEGFCWHARYNMGLFVTGYEAWHDTAWLDWGVKYYDFVLGKMSTGPDGYKGWIGPFIYHKKVWCDVHVGDSVLLDGMLEFSELVLKDDALAKTYGKAARRYVDVAKRDLIEKWDARGTWREDGPYGAYVSWNRYGDPNQLKDWTERPEIANSTLSLPFNKQNDMALVCMKLWRITGDATYRDKAVKIFSFMRSRMQVFDDHTTWNYWEPFGPWDVELAKGDTRHWMNTHPHRNYQAGEVGQIAEAYHTGLVFTKADIQRMINTNLKVMWNGDRKAPRFHNSNVTHPGRGKAGARFGGGGHAGCLWTGLVDFDRTIRDLRAGELAGAKGSNGAIAKARFEKVTLARPPGFDRRHVRGQPVLPDFPASECRTVNVAAVMPCVIRPGTKSIVLSKLPVAADLEVAVWSADGKQKLLVLHAGKVEGGLDGHAGIHILQWDGTDPAGKLIFDGDYRVRWTVAPDDYREFPVTVVPAGR